MVDQPPRIDSAISSEQMGAPLQAAERHPLDYLRTVYRYRWVSISAFVFVMAAAGVYCWMVPRVYQARVQLLIEPDNPRVVEFREVIDEQAAKEDYYQTQYRLLRSRALARQTLEGLQLWNDAEFARAQPLLATLRSWIGRWLKIARAADSGVAARRSSPAAGGEFPETAEESRVIDKFLERLAVEPVRNSRLLDITFEASNPLLAARAANAVARGYIDRHLEFKSATSKEAFGWLDARLAQQRKQVEAAELALQRYREQNDAVSLAERQNVVVQGLADLNAAVTRSKTERIEKETLFNQLESIAKNPAALRTHPAISSNLGMQANESQMATLRTQEAQLAEQVGKRHPDLIKLRNVIDNAERTLERQALGVVAGVREELVAARDKERGFLNALAAQKAEALALDRRAIEYGVLEREATSARQMFETLLQRSSQTGIAGELRTSNIRIIDYAEVPRRPVWPRTVLILAAALLSAALLSGGLPVALDYLDDRMRIPEEIATHLGLPCLGFAPAVSKKTLGGRPPLLNDGVPEAFAEALRIVCANLLFSSPAGGSRSVLFTSTAAGEGKTVLVSNLGIALARSGHRVVLVDADMRRPRLHEIFNERRTPGLRDVLLDNAPMVPRQTTIPGLFLLSAGAEPENAADVLAGERLRPLVHELAGEFDWVLIDSPAVMAFADACLLARAASAVVFVVAANATSRGAAHAALHQLDLAEAPMAGAVLSRIDLRRDVPSYPRSYRRTLETYQHSAARPARRDMLQV